MTSRLFIDTTIPSKLYSMYGMGGRVHGAVRIVVERSHRRGAGRNQREGHAFRGAWPDAATPALRRHLAIAACQHEGTGVLYAFDKRRTAVLLLGGDKTGNPNWYNQYVPIADELFDAHLKAMKDEQEKKNRTR